MDEKERKEEKAGISEMIREGFEESWRSLSRIETEGEKLIRGLVDVAEKYGLDAGTKAVEEVGRDAREFLNQLNEAIEENTQKVLEGLNVPTRADLDLYNRKMKTLIDENVKARLEKLKVPSGKDFDAMGRQLRGNLEEQLRKGLGRLNLATRKEVDAVVADLRKLRKDVAKLSKASVSSKKKASPGKTTKRKTAPKKKVKAATRRKTATKKR
jgi:polyhydroxyalkanoate synthesis regulator phasin